MFVTSFQGSRKDGFYVIQQKLVRDAHSVPIRRPPDPGLAAKAFAPASCFPRSLRRVTYPQIYKICEKVRLEGKWDLNPIAFASCGVKF